MRRLLVILIAAAALLAGCGIGNPWPDQPALTPSSSAHHELLAIGDSLLGQTDTQLEDVLTGAGMDVTTVDAHVNGTGLIGPMPYTDPTTLEVTWYPSTLAWVQHQLEAHPEADTVVLEYGGACSYCDLWAPGSVSYGSDAFYSLWVANAKGIIDWLHQQGKVVLWTSSPQSGASGDTIASGSNYRVEVASWLSFLDSKVLAPYAGTASPDWWTALNDTSGAFQQQLYYDDAVHDVRAGDLVHLVKDGAVRTATWTMAALRSTWATMPAPPAAQLAPQGTSPLVEAGDPVTLEPTAPTP